MRSKKRSLLVLWHLLSLDAPTVAVSWAWFIACSHRIHLPAAPLLAMGTAVWLLYVADRLLDGQRSDSSQLEVRHYFHRDHRVGFLVGVAIASTLLAVLLPDLSPDAVRLYLILGGLVFGYFVVIHATSNAHWLPKEIAVGVCFAAAVFIPTVARAPALRGLLLLPAALFAALCSLNCLMIYAWEHPAWKTSPPHPMTALALRSLNALTMTAGIASAALLFFARQVPWTIPTALAISAAALLLLHRRHDRYDTLTLRAAADLALLTPLLLAWFR